MKKGFIIIYCLITLLGFASIFKTPNLTSEYENRTLSQYPLLTIRNFINQNFQNDFEAAFKDQFWLSQNIKIKSNNAKKILTSGSMNKQICVNNYVKVTDQYYDFNCDDYLFDHYVRYSSEQLEYLRKRIADYSNITKYAELYYYFVNRGNNFDFSTNTKSLSISDYLNENFDELDFQNYDEYKNYFYKTDHHWNYKGSYQGYQDIVKLMFGESEKTIDIKNEKEFDIIFYGSFARLSTFKKYQETFKVYTFDIPEHETYINGQKEEYGHEEEYLKGIYKKNSWENHYGSYYGGDDGEVIFDFKQDNKENLLILGNSYSNAVNKLIASHFNKTYVIDLRHYKSDIGQAFDYKKYITENKIDKVLVICDITYLLSDMFDLEGGNEIAIY